ncbi:SymE family type I addiction module toxin [Flavobacterium sp. NKUCC04_CG]|uniref:SymE family type I addiction module toxin n=1 Tax=Flavobacterium sp. NKUCC04_CG TaxID=2842121 RepID=UPI001C5BB517|nr:SymE family type I addiction module toxin [Flavobacterium sp. NKUCC04_CG]MBW3519237.1 type I toxin-antitoxin system SymE family toxin [Flavobacterium sp. NKUCC04_CG]
MRDFRKLKIYTKYQSRSNGLTSIPEIRLEGKWLEKLGFKQGLMVNIEQRQNKLIITIDKESK